MLIPAYELVVDAEKWEGDAVSNHCRSNSAAVVIACASATLLTVSCVSTYQLPSESVQVAIVEVDQSKFTSGEFGDPRLELFDAYSDANCSKEGNQGRIAALGRFQSEAKPVRVEAGKELFFRAKYGDIHNHTAQGFDAYLCTNVVSFTPQANQHYTLYQTPNSEHCSLTVIDGHGLRPPGFVTHAVSAGCAKN
jgi:hypothetical protein